MVFNNYVIPEKVTEEEEFAYKLMDKMYCIGSGTGFVLGELSGLIARLKKENAPAETIAEAEKTLESISSHFESYEKDVYQMVLANWKRLGEPLSMEAHIEKKKRLDAEDEYKSEYCDR